jgi:thimet oligopeptidase
MEDSTNLEQKLWIHWNMTGEEIIDKTKKMIEKSITLNKKILDVDFNNKKEYDNFISYLSDDLSSFTVFHSMCSFLQFVSYDKSVRQSSNIADMMLTEYINRLNMNKPIYDKILEFYNIADNKDDLNKEDERFLNKLIRTYKRNGITLRPKNREMLLKVSQEISKIENNICLGFKDVSKKLIGLTEEEIRGLPNSFIKNLKIVDTDPIRYGIEMNVNSLIECHRYLKNSTIRKNLEFFHNNQYVDLIENIVRLLVLRDKKAKILGYNNHSDYKLRNQMAKCSNNVKEFLTELLHKLDTRYLKEVDVLLKFKKRDLDKVNQDTKDLQLNSWDVDYYITRWKKEYGLDDQKIREYFPINHVLKAIFDIYQEMFQIIFVKAKDPFTFHKEAVLYTIYDVSSNNKTIIGYLYLDMFDRKGKTKHTRCFCLQPACIYPLKKNKHLIPIVSLVTSLKKNKGSMNILLTHSEVLKLFHEFGHIMHHIFGKTTYCTDSGTNVESDFIETPAQILDNLCWDKNILTRLSKHYKTGQPLPLDKVDKMVKIKNLNIGIHYKKMIFYSIYDQLLHSSNNLINMCEKFLKIGLQQKKFNSILETLTELHKKLHDNTLCGISDKSKQYTIRFNKGSVTPNIFNSVIVGNDGSHYGYLWSKIYSSDIYNEKFLGRTGSNTSLKEVGMEFRNKILAHGGSKNAITLLKEYLGRKPSIDGFLKLYGLDVNPEYSFLFNTDRFLTENLQDDKTSSNISDVYNNIKNQEQDYTNVYSNRFSEIKDNDVSDGENSVQRKINYIKNRLKNEINSEKDTSTDNDYVTENTETLKKYDNIFIKH